MKTVAHFGKFLLGLFPYQQRGALLVVGQSFIQDGKHVPSMDRAGSCYVIHTMIVRDCSVGYIIAPCKAGTGPISYDGSFVPRLGDRWCGANPVRSRT